MQSTPAMSCASLSARPCHAQGEGHLPLSARLRCLGILLRTSSTQIASLFAHDPIPTLHDPSCQPHPAWRPAKLRWQGAETGYKTLRSKLQPVLVGKDRQTKTDCSALPTNLLLWMHFISTCLPSVKVPMANYDPRGCRVRAGLEVPVCWRTQIIRNKSKGSENGIRGVRPDFTPSLPSLGSLTLFCSVLFCSLCTRGCAAYPSPPRRTHGSPCAQESSPRRRLSTLGTYSTSLGCHPALPCCLVGHPCEVPPPSLPPNSSSLDTGTTPAHAS
ncbi:hypothetical protein B0T24DRAFT_82085 [Lasiosphaeria ovina]|uniref:Uncharacterized protein n=1 Tax=Lasiosphaeria ovina TaxID=92902 RepID=A0AAE0TYS8_9PEZI|nr:hypothetical protein B0T24DRAFT_82085 [Lasiosphaeria ovina]